MIWLLPLIPACLVVAYWLYMERWSKRWLRCPKCGDPLRKELAGLVLYGKCLRCGDLYQVERKR